MVFETFFVLRFGASGPASERSGGTMIVAHTVSVLLPPTLSTVTVRSNGIGSYFWRFLFAMIFGAVMEHSKIGSVGGMKIVAQQVTSGWLSKDAVMQTSTFLPFVRRFARRSHFASVVP